MEANTNVIAHQIADELLGILPATPQPPLSAVAAPSIAELEQYVGSFTNSIDGSRIAVSLTDGELVIRDRSAKPVGLNKFLVGGQVAVTFRDANIADVDMGGGKTFVMRRAAEGKMPAVVDLKSLEGTYSSGDIGVSYRAMAKNGGLVLELLDGPEFELELKATGPDTFANDGDVYRFARNKAGRVTGLFVTVWGIKDLLLARERSLTYSDSDQS